MSPTNDQELLALYAVEAGEHLSTLNSTLLRLETAQGDGSDRKRNIEAMGRAAHSLKGASRAVGVKAVEKIAHKMESIFDAVQAGKVSLSADLADVLYDALDTIQIVLDDGTVEIEPVLEALEGILTASQTEPVPSDVVIQPPTTPAPPPSVAQTAPQVSPSPASQAVVETVMEPGSVQPIPTPEESIRVSVPKLDELMADISDLLVARSSIEERLTDLRAIRNANARWQKQWRRVRTQYIRAVRQLGTNDTEWRGLLEFLNQTQRYMRLSNQQLLVFDRALTSDSLRLNLVTDSLQDHTRRVRLVPFETYTGLFQRTVRDLAREEGKTVRLQISGTNIELDKRVLESIKDPILHLLRNAIDHGVETPIERVRVGKPPEGMIILAISQRSSNIMLVIADDGRGIDVSAVRRAARRLIGDSEVDAMSDADALSLIMLPGLSTRSQITTISGRGIGLDVVRQNVESLQGRISIENTPGGGTTFRMVIPVSLSTIRCMFARIGNETYAIPTASIEQIINLESLPTDARFSTGGRAMITVDGQALGLVSLAEVLERATTGEARYALILASGERRIAFMVDDLITEQDAVVKNLNYELSRVRHVSGATLLGSGEVIIILNVSDLIKTAQGSTSIPRMIQPAANAAQQTQLRPILVVDDSITTRTLEKNILEAAGLEVVTATNGLEALDTLEKTPVALVIADVEMPYMNGFELTTRIRHSDQFSELPVILVTSLDKPEHKESGFRAGADAYIVKGNFNQGELLQTVRQLMKW